MIFEYAKDGGSSSPLMKNCCEATFGFDEARDSEPLH
jgi:hypothetical protein